MCTLTSSDMHDELPQLPLEPGMLIAGKYRVLRILTTGGMGAVLAAHHESLAQRLAIKVLRPELVENQEALARFMREARATARIQSDYVVRTLDVDRLEDGSPFIVMEYLRGRPLDEVIADDVALPVAHAVDFVMEALTGLTAAHQAGVVHRDIKPSNLFITRLADGRSRVKLIDFGISKLLVSVAVSGVLTGMRQLLGSPQHMSPEQITSPRAVDRRTDIWSMGTILYELLAGEPAFDGDSVGELLSRIVSETPPKLDDIRPDIDPDLADIVARAMSHVRAERFETAYGMLRALSSHGTTQVCHSLRLSSFPPPPRVPRLPHSLRLPSFPPAGRLPQSRQSLRPSSCPPPVHPALADVGAPADVTFVSLVTPKEATAAPPLPMHRVRKSTRAAGCLVIAAVGAWLALRTREPALTVMVASPTMHLPEDAELVALPAAVSAATPALTTRAPKKRTASSVLGPEPLRPRSLDRPAVSATVEAPGSPLPVFEPLERRD